MVFFIKATLNEQPPMSREQYLGMIASTWQVIKQLEGNGKVISGGAFVGQRAGVVIVDVDSHEELADPAEPPAVVGVFGVGSCAADHGGARAGVGEVGAAAALAGGDAVGATRPCRRRRVWRRG